MGLIPRNLAERPAHRILSLSALRVLDRILVEHAHHGGKDNGKLPVTYEHFVEFGMDRHAIAPAIRELSALGFIEITERGHQRAAASVLSEERLSLPTFQRR